MKNNASLQGVHGQGENTEKASEQIITMKWSVDGFEFFVNNAFIQITRKIHYFPSF